ncbi:hypothetical protein BamIOP4010DRAFT_3964 [Burkholderia ambifaria IOP40-10]|uniref:Uncharacterized protein n=1 Tax=Burkholderia ambifaria IOP40-10 TaxID=396596 RepID=B1FIV4_9BURK|nr:hypothetical protein BamIOP4010DRAFT_3964 [Burkholderia ambifaria IOP40-10]
MKAHEIGEAVQPFRIGGTLLERRGDLARGRAHVAVFVPGAGGDERFQRIGGRAGHQRGIGDEVGVMRARELLVQQRIQRGVAQRAAGRLVLRLRAQQVRIGRVLQQDGPDRGVLHERIVGEHVVDEPGLLQVDREREFQRLALEAQFRERDQVAPQLARLVALAAILQRERAQRLLAQAEIVERHGGRGRQQRERGIGLAPDLHIPGGEQVVVQRGRVREARFLRLQVVQRQRLAAARIAVVRRTHAQQVDGREHGRRLDLARVEFRPEQQLAVEFVRQLDQRHVRRRRRPARERMAVEVGLLRDVSAEPCDAPQQPVGGNRIATLRIHLQVGAKHGVRGVERHLRDACARRRRAVVVECVGLRGVQLRAPGHIEPGFLQPRVCAVRCAREGARRGVEVGAVERVRAVEVRGELLAERRLDRRLRPRGARAARRTGFLRDVGARRAQAGGFVGGKAAGTVQCVVERVGARVHAAADAAFAVGVAVRQRIGVRRAAGRVGRLLADIDPPGKIHRERHDHLADPVFRRDGLRVRKHPRDLGAVDHHQHRVDARVVGGAQHRHVAARVRTLAERGRHVAAVVRAGVGGGQAKQAGRQRGEQVAVQRRVSRHFSCTRWGREGRFSQRAFRLGAYRTSRAASVAGPARWKSTHCRRNATLNPERMN